MHIVINAMLTLHTTQPRRENVKKKNILNVEMLSSIFSQDYFVAIRPPTTCLMMSQTRKRKNPPLFPGEGLNKRSANTIASSTGNAYERRSDRISYVQPYESHESRSRPSSERLYNHRNQSRSKRVKFRDARHLLDRRVRRL